jgi:hypothetical protein
LGIEENEKEIDLEIQQLFVMIKPLSCSIQITPHPYFLMNFVDIPF